MANFTTMTVNGELTVKNGNIVETAGKVATSTYIHNIYITGTHANGSFYCSLNLPSTSSTACTTAALLYSTFGGKFYSVIAGVVSGTKSSSATTPTSYYFTDLGISSSTKLAFTRSINAYCTTGNSALAADQG